MLNYHESMIVINNGYFFKMSCLHNDNNNNDMSLLYLWTAFSIEFMLLQQRGRRRTFLYLLKSFFLLSTLSLVIPHMHAYVHDCLNNLY